MKMKTRFWAATFSTICFAAPANSDPAALFNQAVADANQISSGLPTSERLSAYERALGSLDRIVAEFPSSEEARLLLSGQDLGSFSPNALRSSYVEELTAYYDTVCEVSPSYTCLAFVSLKSGADLCDNAQTIDDLEVAYENLENALRIFTSQSEKEAFGAVTISTARQCAARNLDTWNRDYFASKLVEMLLLGGQETSARATIENMETPYFRFNGVLALQKSSGGKVDQQYLDRLDRFIDENIAQGQEGNRAPVDAFLATLALRMFAITNSSVPIDYGYAYDAIQKYRNFGSSRSCDSQYASYLFNTLLDFQILLANLESDRRGINAGQTKSMMEMISTRPREIYESCLDGDYYDLTLMSRIHGRLLVTKGTAEAESFRRLIQDRALTREELIEVYLDYLTPSVEDLVSSYFLEEAGQRSNVPVLYVGPFDEGTGWSRVGNDGGHGLSYNPATFPVFKRLVDGADVCRSSEILFRDLAVTPRFDEAVRYMIESPSIDPEVQYSCGDEALEILLGR